MLLQNYPNPFNMTTRISYNVNRPGFVSLKVYNVTGSEAASLVNEQKSHGSYIVTLDASDLASGIYIVSLITPDGSFFKKLVLIK